MLQEQSTTDADSDPRHDGQASTPVSPIKAFVLLLGVLAIAGLVLLVTRSDNPLATPSIRSPNTEASNSDQTDQAEPERLTNSQAKAVFRRLDKRRLAAFRERTTSHLSEVVTDNGSLRLNVVREIRELRREHLFIRPNVVSRGLAILDSKQDRIRFRQIVELSPRVTSEKGKNLTLEDTAERQTILWVMVRRNTGWLLHRARIVEAAKVRSKE